MNCLDCRRALRTASGTGPELRHVGRGLCGGCYDRAKRNDVLIDFERQRSDPHHVMQDWELLRSEGCTIAQAAVRIGLKPDSLSRTLRRARGRAA